MGTIFIYNFKKLLFHFYFLSILLILTFQFSISSFKTSLSITANSPIIFKSILLHPTQELYSLSNSSSAGCDILSTTITALIPVLMSSRSCLRTPTFRTGSQNYISLFNFPVFTSSPYSLFSK